MEKKKKKEKKVRRKERKRKKEKDRNKKKKNTENTEDMIKRCVRWNGLNELIEWFENTDVIAKLIGLMRILGLIDDWVDTANYVSNKLINWLLQHWYTPTPL